MSIISKFKKLGSIFKEDEKLLNCYTVYNLVFNEFPEPGVKDDFNKKEFINDNILMFNDWNIIMALGSAISSTKRRMVNSYNKFKENIKTKSNSLVKAWNNAIKLRPNKEDSEADERYLKYLMKCYEEDKKEAIALYSSAKECKKLLVERMKTAHLINTVPEHGDRTNKRNRDVEKKIAEIEKIKNEWIEKMLKRAKEDIYYIFRARYEGLRRSEKALFRDYSILKKGKKGEETDESKKLYNALIGGTHKFGKGLHSKKTKEVMKAYNDYHRHINFEEWFKSTNKEFYDFCKSDDGFDVEISKAIQDKFPDLGNSRRGSLEKISELKAEIKQLEQSEEENQSSEDISKEPIEKWMKIYNKFYKHYREYLEYFLEREKYFKAAQEAKKQFQSIEDDFKLLERSNLIDPYDKNKYSKWFNEFKKKQEITIFQAIIGSRCYFRAYLNFYEGECEKYKNISKDISRLNADYKQAMEKMGGKFSEVSHVS